MTSVLFNPTPTQIFSQVEIRTQIKKYANINLLRIQTNQQNTEVNPDLLKWQQILENTIEVNKVVLLAKVSFAILLTGACCTLFYYLCYEPKRSSIYKPLQMTCLCFAFYYNLNAHAYRKAIEVSKAWRQLSVMEGL